MTNAVKWKGELDPATAAKLKKEEQITVGGISRLVIKKGGGSVLCSAWGYALITASRLISGGAKVAMVGRTRDDGPIEWHVTLRPAKKAI